MAPLAEPPARQFKDVYTIQEGRPATRGFAGTPAKWIRIGTGVVNRDGSISIKLDATPINGALHVRDAAPRPPAATPTTTKEK